MLNLFWSVRFASNSWDLGIEKRLLRCQLAAVFIEDMEIAAVQRDRVEFPTSRLVLQVLWRLMLLQN